MPKRFVRGVICTAVAGMLGAQSDRPAISERYLGSLKTKDLLQFLPPPPISGDTRDGTDRFVFQSTRSLEGSPRWLLAHSDNDLSVPGLLSAFSCSLNMNLKPETAPLLSAFIARITSQSNEIVGQLKDHYRRKRPFLIDEGPICVARTVHLTESFDYPSGHTAAGWATGLVLAELWPNRAFEILGRARQYGESRVFCGVHNASAVEAGRTTGGAVVAMLHGSASFRKDLDEVRVEVAHLNRKHPVSALSCAAQAETLSLNPYSTLNR